MTHTAPRLVLLCLGLGLLPASMQAATPGEIRACVADRQAAGCATLLSRLFVCAQAPAITGCEELLAAQAEGDAEPEAQPEGEIEPEVTPRAEGELAEEAEADAGLDDGQQGNGCPVIDSADWQAVVGPLDGAEGPHLIVTGQVTLPTPGWQVDLAAGMADRSAMPVQRVMLTATAPVGVVAQVVTGYDLRLETPAIAGADGMPSYRGVLVLCAGTVLAEITEVGSSQ